MGSNAMKRFRFPVFQFSGGVYAEILNRPGSPDSGTGTAGTPPWTGSKSAPLRPSGPGSRAIPACPGVQPRGARAGHRRHQEC